jgi:alpha-beta hydrolase superfamily lysophospholipase
MAAALADGGLADVMVPNLRGHYLSGLERGDIDYIDQLTDDLSDLIGILRRDGPRARVLVGGHSSGGGLALRFAGSQDGHQVDSYLLMAPFLGQAAPTTRKGSGGWARPAYPRIIGLSMLNAVGIRSLNGLKTLAFNMPASARDGTETLTYSYRLMTGFAPHPELSSDLAALPNSSLLLVGLDDEAFLADEYPPLLKKYSQANVVLLPNQTHFSIVRHPDALAEVVQWLQSLDEPSDKEP